MQYKLVAPCYFGTEASAAFDFKRIGAQDVTAEDGRIRFLGDEGIIAAANLHSRSAERILIELASFHASTFDELFEGVRAIEWAQLLPKDAAFPVKGASLSSQLSSVPACQGIVKKAVVESLRAGHGVQLLEENGEEYKIRFSIRKNRAEIFLDTSGEGLHKRGYRKNAGGAPIKETLAATIADLARVRADSVVQDPFCGSGTLLIEAAQKALHIAPGLRRTFAAERYGFISKQVWARAREEALSQIEENAPFEAYGFDIDEAVLEIARQNAKLAGVGARLRFFKADVAAFAPSAESIVLTNPPYGERMGDLEEAARLAAVLGRCLAENPVKGAYIITADAEFEQHFGKKAARRRKLYNGMIPCQLYMYF